MCQHTHNHHATSTKNPPQNPDPTKLSRVRFDSLVHFKPLSKNEIRQVIDRLVDDNFSKLTPDERTQLEPEKIKAMLYPLADKGGNVRKLGKLVDEVISLLLVRALLNDTSQTNSGPNIKDPT